MVLLKLLVAGLLALAPSSMVLADTGPGTQACTDASARVTAAQSKLATDQAALAALPGGTTIASILQAAQQLVAGDTSSLAELQAAQTAACTGTPTTTVTPTPTPDPGDCDRLGQVNCHHHFPPGCVPNVYNNTNCLPPCVPTFNNGCTVPPAPPVVTSNGANGQCVTFRDQATQYGTVLNNGRRSYNDLVARYLALHNGDGTLLTQAELDQIRAARLLADNQYAPWDNTIGQLRTICQQPPPVPIINEVAPPAACNCSAPAPAAAPLAAPGPTIIYGAPSGGQVSRIPSGSVETGEWEPGTPDAG